MKKIIIAAAILVSGFAFNNKAEAQISLNVNIGSQPDWGPVGYDRADYYYMPDIDTYYSVPTREYVYLNDNRWIRSRTLPSRYSNYNVYNNYKVVINEPNPWERATVYRTRYASYKGRHDQVIIRNSKDAKFTKAITARETEKAMDMETAMEMETEKAKATDKIFLNKESRLVSGFLYLYE
jgi:hypothetical protein